MNTRSFTSSEHAPSVCCLISARALWKNSLSPNFSHVLLTRMTNVAGGLLPDSACSVLVQPLRPLPQSASSADDASSSNALGNSQEETNSSEIDTSENGRLGGDPDRRKARAAGIMMLWSDRPRALSQRERLWAAAVAAKLYDTLS